MIKPIWSTALGLVLACGLAGCRSTGPAKAEMMQMQQEAERARICFRTGNFEEAERILVSLSERKSVDQPLYQLELISVYLLSGQKDKAHRLMLATHESIEGFFDEKAEQKAASLWGRESGKVFKGEPYERGTLYLFLALSMLERGDVDNALAALKTGLLADSDTEEQTYKADYALLQFMAAKCHALRGDAELRDQMLEASFDSLVSVPEHAAAYAGGLVFEYSLRTSQQATMMPPSRLWLVVSALVSQEKLTEWLAARGVTEHPEAVAEWAHRSAQEVDLLDFNGLVVLWRGTGPEMVRKGQYGEIRMIRSGSFDAESTYSVRVGAADYDLLDGLGSVSYQATTRGGRQMDNVLSSQASFKGATDAGGDVAFAVASQDYGDPMVNLAAAGIGIAFKGLASATKTEADIRHWDNLPSRFEILPLNIAPGMEQVVIRKWQSVLPVGEKELSIEQEPEALLTVIHTRPPRGLHNPLAGGAASGYAHQAASYLVLQAPESVDTNADGMISIEEQRRANEKALAKYDSDQDGQLSAAEMNRMKHESMDAFRKGMVVQ